MLLFLALLLAAMLNNDSHGPCLSRARLLVENCYHVVSYVLPFRTVVQAPRDQLVSEALARVMERFRLSADDFILLKVRISKEGEPGITGDPSLLRSTYGRTRGLGKSGFTWATGSAESLSPASCVCRI